jgi:type IV secretory pathway TrbD component
MRATPITYYAALNRPLHMMGMERRLFFLCLALSSAISFTALFRPCMLILSLGVFSLSTLVGRSITQQDPEFLTVYQRHLRYQKRYEPLSSLQAPTITCTNSVPSFGRRKPF